MAEKPHPNTGRVIRITYRNGPGEVSDIDIVPQRFRKGATDRYRERRVLVDALDVERGEVRQFVLGDILAWAPQPISAPTPEPESPVKAPSAGGKRRAAKRRDLQPAARHETAAAVGELPDPLDVVDAGVALADLASPGGVGEAVSDFVGGLLGGIAHGLADFDFGGFSGFGD